MFLCFGEDLSVSLIRETDHSPYRGSAILPVQSVHFAVHKRCSLPGTAERENWNISWPGFQLGVLCCSWPLKAWLFCSLPSFMFKDMGSTLWLEKDLQATN